MIRDAFMVVADNVAISTLNLTQGAAALLYLLPRAADESKALDLKTANDFGQGRPITAHFRISTSFGAAADNSARFCVVAFDAADQTDLTQAGAVAAIGASLVTPYTPGPGAVLAMGQTRPTVQLVAGTHEQLVVPPLPSYALSNGADPANAQGRRYLGLALLVTSITADWNAGVYSAWFECESTDAQGVKYPSGYTV